MENQSRFVFIDYLRAFAIIGVVLLHVASPYLYLYGDVSMAAWQVGNIFDSLVRWCVPIFFMISGALLLRSNKEPSLKEIGVKTFTRLGIPFLIWSVVYYSYKLYKGVFDFGIADFFKRLINDGIQYHFWYIYALIPIYLIAPLLTKWIQRLTDKQLIYLMTIGFITVSLLPAWNFAMEDIKVTNYTPIKEYFYLFLLGYVLFRIDFTKRARLFIYCLGALGAVLTIILTTHFTAAKGSFEGFFYYYHSPTVILMGIALFTWTKQVCKQPNAIIQAISATSFGVYFVHLLVLDLIEPYFIQHIINTNLLIAIPVNTIFVLLSSMLVIGVLYKIPKLKPYIG